ncbi:MAG: NAD(P)/FAD-dependent oxidoreductase [Candidatus Thorarchaeota archaeon]|jgi:NADH oxidase (H2O2-forming)
MDLEHYLVGKVMHEMKITIIGYGPGGVAAATAAKTFDSKAEVVILTEESLPAHKKPGATMALEHPETRELEIRDWSYEALRKRGIKIKTGVKVVGGDLDKKSLDVLSADGKSTSLEYDRLIIAIGGVPSVPELPGRDLPGVYTIQSMAETSVIGKELQNTDTIVIVGAGFSGLETAERLHKMGKNVHLIIRSRLMRKQLEEAMSEDLLSRIPHGIKLHLGSAPTSVIGSKHVTAIEVGGKEIETGIVLFMTGVRPNSALAEQLGLKVGALGGISINNQTETSKEGVFAVGDCVEMTDSLTGKPRLMPIGSTAARAGRQAGVAAVGSAKVYDDTSVMLQYDRIFDTDIVCVGHSSTSASDVGLETDITYLDDPNEAMKVALVTNREGRLIGGQVISARMGARVGYEILNRVEAGLTLKERPMLQGRHEQILSLLERTFGPMK